SNPQNENLKTQPGRELGRYCFGITARLRPVLTRRDPASLPKTSARMTAICQQVEVSALSLMLWNCLTAEMSTVLTRCCSRYLASAHLPLTSHTALAIRPGGGQRGPSLRSLRTPRRYRHQPR